MWRDGFRCAVDPFLQSEQDGATLEQRSDVEDPRSALKDGRGVGRELGPHQMFLNGDDKTDRQVHTVDLMWTISMEREKAAAMLHTATMKWDETVAATLSESIGSGPRRSVRLGPQRRPELTLVSEVWG